MAKKKNTVLVKSERLYLSPMKIEDAAILAKWQNDPEIYGHIRDVRKKLTVEGQVQWIKNVQADPCQEILNVYYLPEDKLIGNGGIMHINWEDKKGEVGMAIAEKAYQGMGLGAEALWLFCHFGFEVLKLHNILGENYSNNPIAINNAKKVGLKYYGTRRESKWHDGKFIDVYYSDMLPHELIKPEIKK